MRCRKLVGIAVLAAAAPSVLHAQDKPRPAASGSFLERFNDWEAHRSKVGGVRVCYAATKPTKSTGKYKRRGEIVLFVSFWPDEKIAGQFEIRAGYTYKAGSAVRLVFNNGAAFRLTTRADSAWSARPAAERKIVRHLADRRSLKVYGRSSRGTRTVDTYSLNGFRAAVQRARAACGM